MTQIIIKISEQWGTRIAVVFLCRASRECCSRIRLKFTASSRALNYAWIDNYIFRSLILSCFQKQQQSLINMHQQQKTVPRSNHQKCAADQA